MKTTIFNLGEHCFKERKHQHISTVDIKDGYGAFRRIVSLIALFALMTGFNSFGQDVFDLSSKLREMNTSGDSSQIREAIHIKSLVTDLYPTIYIGEVVIAKGDSSAVRVDVSATSLGKLSLSNPLFGKVELITIRFNSEAELSSTIDLSSLIGFSSLKYIRLLCLFECSPEKLATVITGDNSGIIKLYSISIPS
jgi:hypothetical protein